MALAYKQFKFRFFEALPLILLFIISCSYPDIDTVPNFGTLSISMQESIDLCKISNSDKENIEDCYKDLKNIINGL